MSEIFDTENKETEFIPRDLSDADSRTLADAAVKILDSKLAKSIELLSVRAKTVVTDYFVVCTATSNTHVKALADELEYKLGQCGVDAIHMDGVAGGEWTVMDFNTVIVHIFTKNARDFYKLDKLWNDAEAVYTE